MITVDQALKIHKILIDEFGGSPGLRDRGLLESAIERPQQTFDKKELYPNPINKSAALLESIVKNHPFIDGNKRTGYVLARLTLMEYKFDIIADQNDKYEFVIKISKGNLTFEQICEWLRDHTQGNIV